MADIALGSVGKIVEIALKIKEAVETVQQNEKECHDIQRCAARVSALLRKLDEMTETMKDEVMRDALEDLAESLERALELVTECQRKHIFRRFLGAGDMAKELGRVQDDIVRKLQLGNFATNVQTTIMVTNIQSAGGPPPPPPLPQRQVIIDGFTMFSLSELKAATENFSDGNNIGSGGTGDVYKDGQVVAIKKLHDVMDDSWLYDEINVFVDLKHKNIIRPLGYCHEVIMVLNSLYGKCVRAEHREFCFVEEYMENGSMEKIINAKKLDLGVEKSSDTNMVGTMPYMPPEYMFQGIVSTKCDVYAFGITLLGTIIGSMSMSTPSGLCESIQWAFEARDDVRMELFKPSLCCKSQLMQIKKCMEVGLLCVELDKEHRPTMADVLAMLNGVKELPALKRPYPYINFDRL
ncbi:unnamed protein product [Miscanthus lutarioriparius]|uniref:Protein kinase domain-containing protein n=1 Tax=Miscanthus lutarioriparius TaxID=422564 RepID=A0A811P272_9POAL|nr:unnamed protein product [Miscanthus lutarioriparius]